MHMVDILHRFIKAERTGNWELHLQTVYEMLPYFAASGHNQYAKSAYIYLQFMRELEEKHPDVYRNFQEGLHVVRRSDRYWAGLSTDLAIEQVLMRSVKTSGGLTRGRGMTETQRLVWLLSMPACAEVNNAMQDLTSVKYHTSEQHKEATRARQERDFNDTKELLSFVELRNPFSPDPSLRSIVSGVIADDKVNVDKSEEVGNNILRSMVGKSPFEYSFKKKDQAVTLASKTTVKINEESVQIDPQLLFQRLSVLATGGRYEDPKSHFKFEMCSYPPSLFESSLLPRQANKPALADAIWTIVKNDQIGPEGNVHYVLDGGALLHRIPWPRGMTYDAICNMYVEYVIRRYGQGTIVFDGYQDGPSTNDATHQRRTGAYAGPTVNFASDMVLKSKKDEFLANKSNKQKFINHLSDRLEMAGCTTDHATSDADLLIVQTTVTSAKCIPTVLVGDDTDLLVLLCYHADMNTYDIFFQPEPKKKIAIQPDVAARSTDWIVQSFAGFAEVKVVPTHQCQTL
ncbi:hypothetical protein QZH41_001488 [Actinostola sp. cb2023]|nr:hypothetical protein QZH41_001488 [Actinostola sp. cb2023]